MRLRITRNLGNDWPVRACEHDEIDADMALANALLERGLAERVKQQRVADEPTDTPEAQPLTAVPAAGLTAVPPAQRNLTPDSRAGKRANRTIKTERD